MISIGKLKWLLIIGKIVPRYGWRDCVGFAQDIADAVGLRHGWLKTQLPTSIIQDLRNMN
jgi:hypothetical protein